MLAILLRQVGWRGGDPRCCGGAGGTWAAEASRYTPQGDADRCPGAVLLAANTETGANRQSPLSHPVPARAGPNNAVEKSGASQCE